MPTILFVAARSPPRLPIFNSPFWGITDNLRTSNIKFRSVQIPSEPSLKNAVGVATLTEKNYKDMDERTMFPLYCRYQNTTTKFQIIIVNSINTLEKLLMPGMSIEFPAQLEDYITVKDGLVTSIFADNIPCQKLSMSDVDLLPR